MSGTLRRYTHSECKPTEQIRRGEVIKSATGSLHVKISNNREFRGLYRPAIGDSDHIYLRIEKDRENSGKYFIEDSAPYRSVNPSLSYTVIGRVDLDSKDNITDRFSQQEFLFMAE